MNRMLAVLDLLLITLTACATPTAEIQTQTMDIPTSAPTPTHLVVEMTSIGDGGLLSGQPCASPCFFGIRFGETRVDQVIPTLKANNIAPCYQIDATNIFCGAADTANVSVTIDRKTNIVDGVGYDPSISISVGKIVEKYGYPNSVYVELDGTPEATTISMLLLWDSIKMGADLGQIPDIGTQSYPVTEITEVQWISFSEVTYIESSQAWNGYGVYKP